MTDLKEDIGVGAKHRFVEIVFSLGNPGDMPIAGDWDGVP
jgi:hypothetical protein